MAFLRSHIVSVLATFILLCTPVLAEESVLFRGRVVDSEGRPIAGATVALSTSTGFLAGQSADSEGRYALRVPLETTGGEVTISAIGFLPTVVPFTRAADLQSVVRITLTETEITLGTIAVMPAPERQVSEVRLHSELIVQRSTASIVSNNPIAALRQPQIQRQGSNYSSKIRVNGTNPTYYLNGLPIGTDRTHYGMFSILPGTAVREVRFYPLGTSARYTQPVGLDLLTPTPFGGGLSGEMELSLVQGTASAAYGTNRFFTMASMRKSVLDKLTSHFEVASDRRTLPPTNFQDLFISSGVKLGRNHLLMLDQFYSRDYLDYSARDESGDAFGIDASQHTRDSYAGLRLHSQFGAVLMKTSFGFRTQHEEYSAGGTDPNPYDVQLSLHETSRRQTGSLDLEWQRGSVVVFGGVEAEAVLGRRTDMIQRNWNFLPPDATSDNPSIYQPQLNRLYGKYASDTDELAAAGFVGVKTEVLGTELESGFRVQYFDYLATRKVPVWRQQISRNVAEDLRVTLFAGTFAESPLQGVLEAYQVLVRSDLPSLEPVRTWLAAATVEHRGIAVNMFVKEVSQVPVMIPDLSATVNRVPVDGFIRMQPETTLRFIGADLSFERERFLSRRLRLYAYYGYTHAVKSTAGIESSYELNAPHKFSLELGYTLSRAFSLGFDFAARSGLAYTPTLTAGQYHKHSPLSAAYYEDLTSLENSARFATNMYFNISGGYSFGNQELFFSVTNATNHKNAIINTAGGHMYDAGVFPSLGYRVKF